jgi:hypothetical protein
MPAPKARTRHTQFTTEAFRELAEAALEELCENSATLEMKDLATWSKDLKLTVGRVSDHRAGGDPPPAVGDGPLFGGFASLED